MIRIQPERFERNDDDEDDPSFAIADRFVDINQNLGAIASALKWLGSGDAYAPDGAIGFLGIALRDGLGAIAAAQERGLLEIADAIRETSPTRGTTKAARRAKTAKNTAEAIAAAAASTLIREDHDADA